MEKIAFIFSGQGSQKDKLFEDFMYESNVFRSSIKEVQKYTDIDLVKSGTKLLKKDTNCTLIAQPTIFAKQVGEVDVLKKEFNIAPYVSMGMSLGQFSAMYSSDFSTLDNLSKIVNMRANLMSLASEKQEDTQMLAIISINIKKIIEIFNNLKLKHTYLSNDNSDTQVVFAGKSNEINVLKEKIDSLNIAKTIILNTEGAFHTNYYKKAGCEFGNYLKQYGIFKSKVPIIDNLTGKITNILKPDELGKQMSNTVLWKNSVYSLKKTKPDVIVELGSGSSLKHLTKIDGTKYFSIEKYSDIFPLKEYLRSNGD